MCTQFTDHGFNNCLKFYSVDILEPVSNLSFLLPFLFPCLMAGQRNHVLVFLVQELIQALWPGKFPLSVADYAQMLFSIPEMCLQIVKAHFEESCKCLV